MLKQLGLSRSGYYSYINHKPSKSEIRKVEITAEVKKIHKESREIYGAPKITKKLAENGIVVSEKYVGNIMRENNIKAKYIKPYTVTTHSLDFSNNLKNILKREFNPTNPNEVWCTDITYIHTKDEGFVYLTSIMDLYSRKIVAWELSRTMEATEVLKALEKAKKRRNVTEALVIHSDRGVQFTSELYDRLTENIKKSYSAKGNPWDNACIESFHSLIKREWLNDFTIHNYAEAYNLVFEYIEGFYNTVRIHSHCDYKSPTQYENTKLN